MRDSIYVRAMAALNNILVVLGVVLGVALIATQATADPIEIPTYNYDLIHKNIVERTISNYIDTTPEKSHWSAHTAQCNNTDIGVGIGVGVATGIAATIGTVAGMTLVGPGVAAGATVGVARAVTMPFLTKTTVPMAAGIIPTIGGLAGIFSYSASCIFHSYVNNMY